MHYLSRRWAGAGWLGAGARWLTRCRLALAPERWLTWSRLAWCWSDRLTWSRCWRLFSRCLRRLRLIFSRRCLLSLRRRCCIFSRRYSSRLFGFVLSLQRTKRASSLRLASNSSFSLINSAFYLLQLHVLAIR